VLILRRYARGYLVPDVLATLPLGALLLWLAHHGPGAVRRLLTGPHSSDPGDTHGGLESNRLIKLVRLVRLRTLFRAPKLFGGTSTLHGGDGGGSSSGAGASSQVQDPGVNPVFAEFANLIAALFLIAHLLGCCWHAALAPNPAGGFGPGTTWLVRLSPELRADGDADLEAKGPTAR